MLIEWMFFFFPIWFASWMTRLIIVNATRVIGARRSLRHRSSSGAASLCQDVSGDGTVDGRNPAITTWDGAKTRRK